MKMPLVLLPGTLCDERLFAHQIEVLGTDRRIHVGDVTCSDTIAGMAKDVLAASPDRFALAGLSLGGIVAMEIMRVAPERVARLALLDTSARAATPAQQRAWDEFAAMTGRGEFVDITSRELLPKLIHRNDDPALRELVIDMARAIGPDAFLRQNAAQPTRPNSLQTLPAVTCPTVVVHGQHDLICSVEMHKEIADAVPGASLVEISGAGHLATLDNPEAVTSALSDWLGWHPPTDRQGLLVATDQ